MWLAKRPKTTPSAARAWYTHVVSTRLRKHVRQFTGKVSQKALDKNSVLRLEHFKRMQTTLTQLISRHLQTGENPDEFVRNVLDCEQVHIVTAKENYEALKAKGDYTQAGIELIDWKDISPDMQRFLWQKILRGKVANADNFVWQVALQSQE